MMSDEANQDVTSLTVQLLSAYLSNNPLPSNELPGLIALTRAALIASPEVHQPVVSIRKSLASREHILSLIDGKPYKTLTRHLGRHGLTPDDYRARYKLPADYPMVAPDYSDHRRTLAKGFGLGRKVVPAVAEAPALPAVAQSDVEAAPKRLRAPKATGKGKVKAATDAAPEPVSEGSPSVSAAETAATPAPKRMRKSPAQTAKAKDVGVSPTAVAKAPKLSGKAKAAAEPAPVETVTAKKAAKPVTKRTSKPKAVAGSVTDATAAAASANGADKSVAKPAKQAARAEIVPAQDEVKPAAQRSRKARGAGSDTDTPAKPARNRRMARGPEATDARVGGAQETPVAV